MQYLASDAPASRQISDCVVVGIYDKRRLNTAAAHIDGSTKARLTALAKQGDLPTELGKTTMLRGLTGVKSARVLVVGLGKKSDFSTTQLTVATESAVRALAETGAKSAIFNLADRERFADTQRVARATVLAAHAVLYRFDQLKTSDTTPAPKFAKLGLGCDSKKDCTRARAALQQADAIAQGISLAKDLGNQPANVCTPQHLASVARKIAREHNSVTAKVMGLTEIKKLGMGAFLSVTQGAERPPRLIVLNYRGASSKTRPIALVGKGITFDTGGISLKPPPAMDEMKFDMCGAASVLGAFAALAALQLPINVVGIVPACENMPSGKATRPGDIVTTMAGKTVEILNTDAEGRLILCDALWYARKFKPQAIIDIATLTGACVIALGDQYSGLMSPHDELADELLSAGKTSGDLAWRMPVTEHYVKKLKSNFADFSNIGGRPAGATTAACFLWQFAKDQNWAHLDIAGSAWKSGAEKGATGRPVSLLVQYLIDKGQAQK